MLRLEAITPTIRQYGLAWYRWLRPRIMMLLVAALTLIGAVLRLWDLTLAEFRHDSAWWALEAVRMHTERSVPLIGQQVGSVQIPFYNGPIFAYVTAIVFGLAGQQPIVMNGFIALCNVAAIPLTYWLGKRLYSAWVGVVAAAMLAGAPWMVLYGRMFWPQALFPFLMPLAWLCLVNAVERQQGRWYLGFGILGGIGLQLHLSVLAIIGTGIFFVLLYARPRLRGVAIYGIGVLLGYLPVVIYDFLHGFSNLRGMMMLPSIHATHDPRILHIAKTIWNFSNVLSGQGLWVSKLAKEPFIHPVIEWSMGFIFSILFCFAIIFILINHYRQDHRARIRFWQVTYQDALVIIFVVFPLAYLLLSRGLIQRHYFIFFAPLTMIVVARGLELWRSTIPRPRWVAAIPLGLLGVGLSLNLFTSFMLLSFLHQRGGEGEYGTVLADKQAAVATMVAIADSDFVLDLSDVREPLPFIFLVQSHVPVQVVGAPDTATELRSHHTSLSPRRFRIVELPYATLSVHRNETVHFQRRGVVLIEQ